MVDKEYREMSGINQSMLKKLPTEPYKVKQYLDGTLVEESKSYFVFGAMVDTLLTEGLKAYNKKFVVCKEYPTDSIKEVIDKALHNIKADLYESSKSSHVLSDDLSTYKVEVFKAMNELNYQTNWKDETRYNKVVSLGEEYFKFCLSVKDKVIVSIKDNSDALACYMGISSNPAIKSLLSKIK